MAVVCRESWPVRTIAGRGARTGLVALLVLSAGAAGCGQPLLRAGAGAGVRTGRTTAPPPPAALGRADEAVPGRKLAWNGAGAGSESEAARSATAVASGVPGLTAPVSLDGMTAAPSVSLATFDGSTFARTTWNGWKLPAPKSPASVDAPLMASAAPRPSVAPDPAPAPTSSPSPSPAAAKPVDLAAVAGREAKIAMPTPLPSAPGASTLDDSLLAACRTTKIAPPLRKAPVAVAVAASTKAGPLDRLASAVRETQAAPTPNKPAPAAETLAASPPDPVKDAPVLVPAPAEVAADEATKSPEAGPKVELAEVNLPAPPAGLGPDADRTLRAEAKAKPPEAEDPIPAPIPVAVVKASPADTLAEALAKTQIEAPVPYGTFEGAADLPTVAALTPEAALEEALRVTQIEAPRRPEPDDEPVMPGTVDDRVSQVSQVTRAPKNSEYLSVTVANRAPDDIKLIPPPAARGGARRDPLLEACRAAQIPPPVSARPAAR